MILLIDNYDSFAYNLQDYLLQLHFEVTTKLNDRISVDEVRAMQPEAIVFSPGPKTPSDAGVLIDLIDQFHTEIPMLGICLGHQAIGMYFGAELIKGAAPVHGKTAMVRHHNDHLFKDLPNPFQVMRYHSLVLEGLGGTPLEIIGSTPEKTVMAIRHREFPLYGLQFHPESILTPQGLQILSNWGKLISTPQGTSL